MKILKKLINLILKLFNLKIIKIANQFSNSYRLVLSFNEKKIDYILDVGANEGQFVRELRFYGYRDKVLSFEPFLDAHKKLIEISKNDNDWEIFRPLALGNKNTKSILNISKNSVSSSILNMNEEHIDNAPDSRFISKQSIEESKLDNIFSELNVENKNLFLKIDTQGYEFQVLEGARKNLHLFKGILVEVSLTELYEGQKPWLEIVNFIQNYGFKLWSVDRGFSNKKNGKTLQMDLCFFK